MKNSELFNRLMDLDLIGPNPYQPRENEDPEHIRNLAISIAQDGLLQAPAGRWVEGRVQLAFGHSRLAAYKFLRDTGNPGFELMPVVIRVLSDEDMFRLAISENLQRRDLTPIEEARAMTRYRDEFGKSSMEIGGLFGLSDSAVRNKIRLLKLPQSLQDALRRRDLTEGAARALVPLYDLPAEVRAMAEDSDELKPSLILEVALSGAAPIQIANLVGRFEERVKSIKAAGQQLSIEDLPEPEPAVSVETPAQISPWPENMDSLMAPEPEPIPVLERMDDEEIHQVSQAYLEEDREYQGKSEPVEEVEKIQEPEPQAIPAPVPTPEPKKKLEAVKAQPEPVQAAKPAAKPQPVTEKPAAAINLIPEPAATVKPLTWEESTITFTVTYWPEDGNEAGRAVMVGARLNQGLPKMLMLRADEILMPAQLVGLLGILRMEFGGLA
jgi:ParB/RepB/Spo0J family partition protein